MSPPEGENGSDKVLGFRLTSRYSLIMLPEIRKQPDLAPPNSDHNSPCQGLVGDSESSNLARGGGEIITTYTARQTKAVTI